MWSKPLKDRRWKIEDKTVAKEINTPFIDIHCHILPNLDDGSKNMEQTLNMLKIACEEGITDIICTPHHHLGRVVADYDESIKRIEQVREQLKCEEWSSDISIYLGTELCYFVDAVDELMDGRIHTMNNTNYVLIEFDPNVEYKRIMTAVCELRMSGYKPIIAHIERYHNMVMEIDECEELIDSGAEIQVNAASILGELGGTVKKFVKKLMKYEMVSYVATDAHSDGHRAPRLKDAYRYVAKKFGEEYATKIFYDNAKRIITKE